MNFSVVMPTYNRSYQLMLTLAAFETQTCPFDQFEIIVMNDGSTDDTIAQLQRFQARAPYRLTAISASETTGRSTARNVGAAAAAGNYIIFCDPDYLVSPDFIKVHADYHRKFRNAVVSGVPGLFRNAYTHVHSDYSDAEKAAMAEVLKRAGLWQEHYWHTRETIPIITPEDVRSRNGKLEQVLAPWDAHSPVYRQFRTTDVAPWLLAVTRSLSMPKHIFKRVGGFDERFQKHGLEDWELGYRLHRRGYKFISMKEFIGYHQDHPAAFRNVDTESENLRLIYHQHGFRNPELTLFAVCPPSEGLPEYKNTLRILRKWRRSKHATDRLAARRAARAFRRSAILFYKNPNSVVYRRSKANLKRAVLSSYRLNRLRPSKRRHRKIRKLMNRACRRASR